MFFCKGCRKAVQSSWDTRKKTEAGSGRDYPGLA